jgi:hypothetical protein
MASHPIQPEQLKCRGVSSFLVHQLTSIVLHLPSVATAVDYQCRLTEHDYSPLPVYPVLAGDLAGRICFPRVPCS